LEKLLGEGSAFFQYLENGGVFGLHFDTAFAVRAFGVEPLDSPFGLEHFEHALHRRNLGFEMP
jgi:hypothetical protein